jgi:hypothetical protein
LPWASGQAQLVRLLRRSWVPLPLSSPGAPQNVAR